MKTRSTKTLLLIVAIVTFSVTGLLAQQLNTTGLYKHGTNSASLGAQVAAELTDSVTIGAAMDYFVMPDALVNPSYNAATSLTANLVSTFDWTATTGTVAA
ncbi:MAG TPA: hypothetical protein VHO90_15630, partial [Bacteroidales bacterium]|nr:hypothetical protein [Bacteroidales bacterium]